MRRDEDLTRNVDWVTVLLYSVMVVMGWLNVFAAVYDPEQDQSIFDLSLNSGKQMLWIMTAVVLIVFIMLIDYKFWDTFAYVIYGAVMLLLMLVLVAGKEVAGSRSWFEIGSFRLQPAELAKFATALAISKYLSSVNVRLERFKDQISAGSFLLLPVGLIMLQGDTGSAMVFASFFIVFFIEGMPPFLIILGLSAGVLLVLTLLVPPNILMIAFGVMALIIILILPKKTFKSVGLVLGALIFAVVVIQSVDYVIFHVMKPHQQNRVLSLVNPNADPLGAGWNVTQSKIAIGSGGFWGKGFLQGTQTKFDFVPEQSTDFIFCTIGEEHGWVGSLVLVGLFVVLLLRLFYLADRQKTRIARIYGYCVTIIFFFHFLVNIGMTIGLFPVVGIPLPFFSYGGSSLWSFTILLFIFLNMDANRRFIL